MILAGLALVFATWAIAYCIAVTYPPRTTAGLFGVLLLGSSGSLIALGLYA